MRRVEIIRRLRAAGFLSVTSLTQQLGVSDMTIRRDLRRLERTGDLRVVHGGASLPEGSLSTVDFAHRGGRETSAKRHIGRLALDLVRPGATIAVDAGTTAFELAEALPSDFHGCVITHSIPVLHRMVQLPSSRVIGLGGELLADSRALVGSLTMAALSGLHAEVLFLGAAAVNPRGVFIATDHERPTKTALMEISDRIVLVADHTKFSAAAPVRLAPLERLDVLVTDLPLKPVMAHAMQEARVDVLVVRGTQSKGGSAVEEIVARPTGA